MTETAPDGPRVLVVGTGFGCRIHAPALRAAGFQVVGLVGSDPDRTRRRAEAAGIARAFTDLSEAIERTGAAAVTIATPPSTHAALTLETLSHGLHVLCEKPMAADVDEARAMLSAAEKAGVVHLIANEFRWDPARAAIARAIAEGVIGQPRLLTLSSTLPLVADPAARMPAWWFDKQAGGGWLGAQGAHVVDQVRTWLGEVESLSAVLPMVSDRPDNLAEDSYVVRLRMRSGAEAVVQQSAGVWGPPDSVTRVAGTHGSLWLEKGVVRLARRDGVSDLPIGEDLALPELRTDDPRKAMAQYELPAFIRLCETFRAGIEGWPQPTRVRAPTFLDGVAAMEILDAIRGSAGQEGALVRL